MFDLSVFFLLNHHQSNIDMWYCISFKFKGSNMLVDIHNKQLKEIVESSIISYYNSDKDPVFSTYFLI